MNPWVAKAVFAAATIAMFVIRAPHGNLSRAVKVSRSYRGARETVLLAVAWIAFLTPLVWVALSVLSFADYPLRPGPFTAGVACLVAGLWLFHRSHADLGKYWSVTLEIRESHELVTHGIYRRIRHPMYTSLLLYGIGQALVVPNWVAGPAYAVSLAILFAFRVGPEEAMMLDTFGSQYAEYVERTKRLVPGVW
jgi:protein-S-isoprenylcysteine O-methyltransferase Ste14